MDGTVNEHLAKARREHLERIRAKSESLPTRTASPTTEETVVTDQMDLMTAVIVADHRLLIALCEAVRDYLDDPSPEFAEGLRTRLDSLQSKAEENLPNFARLLVTP